MIFFLSLTFVQALVRFNEQLAKNSQLRDELETLRVERARFQQLHHKLEKVSTDLSQGSQRSRCDHMHEKLNCG